MSLRAHPSRRQIVAALVLFLAAPASFVATAQEPGATERGVDIASPGGARGFLSPSFVELFEAGQYVAKEGKGHSRTYRYRLFSPKQDAAEQFPLIVWLHGHGYDELEYENIGQLNHLDSLIFTRLDRPQDYPFYCLAVQCPKDMPDWYAGPGEDLNNAMQCPIEAVAKIVDQLSTDRPIDPNRIILAGVSSGAGASWELAIRHPERFAAVAPMAGIGGADLARVANLVDVPVWAFHSNHDSPEQVQQMVAKLQSVGGNCCLTEIPSNRHDCWTAAFGDYGLLRWLLQQERGSAYAPPPGALDWSARWSLFHRDHLRRWSRTDYWLSRATLAGLIAGGAYVWYKRWR